jgi:hypothetical protein
MLFDLGDFCGTLAGRADQERALDGRLDVDQLFDAGSFT